MTLSDTMTALAGNPAVNISIIDAEGEVLITYLAPGYGAIESDLGSRIVKSITVRGAKDLAITLAAE